MHQLTLLVCLISSVLFANTPLTERLVFMVEQGETKQIALKQSNKENYELITAGAEWHLYPDIDSSGRYVTYLEGKDQNSLSVMVKDLSTNRILQVTPKPGIYLHPDFSSDGRFLAYAFKPSKDQPSQIEVLSFNKMTISLKTRIKLQEDCYFPTLSSDGSFLVFQKNNTEDKKEIVSYDFATQKHQSLTLSDEESMAPSLSFDDDLLVFTKVSNNQWDLFSKNLKSGEVLQLTNSPERDFAPHFRRNGAIVFASDKSGHFQLYQLSKPKKDNSTEIVPFLEGEADFYAPSSSGALEVSQGQLKDFPAPARSSFGVAKVQDKVYMIGGHQGAEHTYEKENFVDAVDIFDLKKQTWIKGKPLPRAAQGFDVAVYGKYIYAFGGFVHEPANNPPWHSQDTIYRYDTEIDEWELVARLPRGRSSNVVAVVDEKAYLIGGWDSTPKFPKDLDGTFHDSIDVFDFKTEEAFTLDTKLPTPKRRALSGVVIDNEIYLVGGISDGASTFHLVDNVTVFNPLTLSWRENPKLPFPTFAPVSGVIDGNLFVFGGMYQLGKFNFVYVNHIYGFLKGATSWEHLGRHLSETKGFPQVVNLSEDTLGLLGGHTYETDPGALTTFELFRFFPKVSRPLR